MGKFRSGFMASDKAKTFEFWEDAAGAGERA